MFSLIPSHIPISSFTPISSELPNTPSYGHFLLCQSISTHRKLCLHILYPIWRFSKIDTEVPKIPLQTDVIKIWNKICGLYHTSFLLLCKNYHKFKCLKQYHLLSHRFFRSRVQTWVSCVFCSAEIKVFTFHVRCGILFQVYLDCW